MLSTIADVFGDVVDHHRAGLQPLRTASALWSFAISTTRTDPDHAVTGHVGAAAAAVLGQ